MEVAEKYDLAYQSNGYASAEASIGLKLVPWVLSNLKFTSVLDVGCGSGHSLLRFNQFGKPCTGTEISKTLLDGRLKSMVELGIVRHAYAQALPFPDNSFGLTFCTEVLEHIEEPYVHKTLSGLLRVAKKYVFVTIDFQKAQCFPELELHETVKPKGWWEAEIKRFRVRLREVPTEREDGACYVIQKV